MPIRALAFQRDGEPSARSRSLVAGVVCLDPFGRSPLAELVRPPDAHVEPNRALCPAQLLHADRIRARSTRQVLLVVPVPQVYWHVECTSLDLLALPADE